MNAKNFDEIVTARADQRVQGRIGEFKRAFGMAYEKLTGRNWEGYSNSGQRSSECALVLTAMNSDNHRKGWPKFLWEKEKDTVRDELLGVMDEMQKAILAASRHAPGENEQEEAKKDGGSPCSATSS